LENVPKLLKLKENKAIQRLSQIFPNESYSPEFIKEVGDLFFELAIKTGFAFIFLLKRKHYLQGSRYNFFLSGL
jgi:hypothetical protein